MGRAVVGGGHSTLDEVLAQEGVHDYSAEFSKSRPEQNEGIYSSVVLQDKAVNRLIEAMAQARAILNFGSHGVGKSTGGNATIVAYRALDRGEEITGQGADIIRERYRQLMSKPRGDILSLWNPAQLRDFAPYRTQNHPEEKSVGAQMTKDNGEWLRRMSNDGIDITEGVVARYEVSHALQQRFRKFIKERKTSADYIDLKWEIGQEERQGISRYAVTWEDDAGLTEEDAFAWAEELNDMSVWFKQKYHKRVVDDVIAELIGDGAASIMGELITLDELQDFHRREMRSIFEKHVPQMGEFRDKWQGKEEEISHWYGDVMSFFADPDVQDSIIDSFYKEGKERLPKSEDDLDASSGGYVTPFKRDKVAFIEMKQEGFRINLESALNPEICISEETLKHLVIRKPTIRKSSPLELLISLSVQPRVDPDGNAPHHDVKLGDLAYADIAYLDDGFGETLADKEFRVPMLTLLEDGRITAHYDQITINLEGCDFLLIANDADNPFLRQKFSGTNPIFDGPMKRRFRLVEWDDKAIQGPDTVDAFPTIINNFKKDYNGDPVAISPEAMNLLYHMQIAGNEQASLFPLGFGELKDDVTHPLMTRVHASGRSEVTADDVRDFFMSRRDPILETKMMRVGKFYVPARSRLAVGQSNILAVNNDTGMVEHVSATVTRVPGTIHSNEIRAAHGDEHFAIGVLDTRMFIQSNFPEFGVETLLSHSGYAFAGGPSSSAANTYALLSAAGDIAIDQYTYITGTVQPPDGRVGGIGGVYGKTRGAWLTHREIYGDEVPLRVMVPEINVEELLRKMQFDRDLSQAVDSGYVEILAHDNVWNGFEQLSGKPRAEYEPALRDMMQKKTREADERAWARQHPLMGRVLGFR